MIFGILTRSMIFMFIALGFETLLLWNLYMSGEIVRVDSFYHVNNETGEVDIITHKINLIDINTLRMLRLIVFGLIILTAGLPMTMR